MTAIVYYFHGSATRARRHLDLPVRIPASGALQPQLSPSLAGADRERDWRLVLYPGHLQPAPATDRTGEFSCAGAGSASASPDFHRPRRRSHQRSRPPQTRNDHGRPGADGHRFCHAAGAIPFHSLAGLPAAAAGDLDGGVFRAGTHFRDSQHNSPRRRAPGEHAVFGDVVSQSAGRCVGWRNRRGPAGTRRRVCAQRSFVSGIGHPHSAA